MSSNEFIALNAAFPRNLIRSDTPVNLLVPVDKADKFQRNLETSTWDSWQPYAAQKGDRLEAIAKRFQVSIERLKEHNQFKLKRGKLVRAQSILVPIKGRGVIATPKMPSAAATEDTNQHRIESGETLFGVARRYGLTVTQLAEVNPGLNANLRVGQMLRLPLNDEKPAMASKPVAIKHVAFKPQAGKPIEPVEYTVKRGDTLLAIAQRFDVSLADIKAWNPAFRKSSTIRPGQDIVVKQP